MTIEITPPADPIAHIKAVNKEYARLLRDCLARHEVFTRPGLTFEELCAYTEDPGSGIVIASSNGSLTPLQKICVDIIADGRAFVRSWGESYKCALAKATLSKLVVENTFLHQLLFFDTVLVAEPLAFWDHPDPRKIVLFVINSLRTFGQWLIPMLEADSDVPLVALRLPPSLLPSNEVYLQARTGHFDDPVLRYAERLNVDFLRRVSRIDTHFDTSLEWRRLGEKGSINLFKLFDIQKFVRFLHRMPFNEDEYSFAPHAKELAGAMRGNLEIVSGGTYQRMLRIIFGVFYAIASQEVSSIANRADCWIADPELYSLKLELDGYSVSDELNLSEEQAAAVAFSSPPFTQVDVDLATILWFRNEKGPGVLREIIGQHRAELKFCAPGDLHDIATKFATAIRDRMDAHADELEALKAKQAQSKAALVRGAVTLGAATALNWLTVPVTLATVSKVINTLWTALVSVPTAPEVAARVQDIRSTDNALQSTGGRPLAIFEGVLGAGKPVFRWPWVL